MSLEAVAQHIITRPGSGRLVEHDDVHTANGLPVLPKRLADDPLQAIARRRQPAMLLADREAESWLVAAIRPVKNGKHIVAAAFRFGEDATEG